MNLIFGGIEMSSNFISPMEGKLLSLEDVNDGVFSKGKLGTGFAVELSNGNIIAPFDGTLLAVFPTGHAYILRNDDGREVMIHIGMDSSDAKECFTPMVHKYDFVKQGTILVKVNLDLLKFLHKSVISPVVFTNRPHIHLLKQNMKVTLGENAIIDIQN